MRYDSIKENEKLKISLILTSSPLFGMDPSVWSRPVEASYEQYHLSKYEWFLIK